MDNEVPEKLSYAPDQFVNCEEALELALDKARRMDGKLPVERRVVIIYGRRGSGKTWLLHELERRVLSLRQGRLGSSITPCCIDLGQQAHPEAILGLLPQDRPLILLLDEVNSAGEKQLDLLEEYVLAPLAQKPDVLIVLAERGQPRYWAIVEFREKSDIYDLGPFGVADIQAQVHKQIPKLVADVAEVRDLGGGYPWATYLLARYLPDKKVALEQCAAAFLAGLNGELKKHLEALVVLRAFDEARMVPLLQVYSAEFAARTWDYAACRQVRAQLVQSTMAYWGKEARGYVVDEPIRRVLEAGLRERDEVLWARLHCEAYRLYEKWAEAYEQSREWWRREQQHHAARLKEAGFTPENCPKEPSPKEEEKEEEGENGD